MRISDCIDAYRAEAHQIGQYSISRFEYTTLQGVYFNGLWIENAEGEGMQAKTDSIPEGATEEWMDQFWKENF